jgi:hypothetical protein
LPKEAEVAPHKREFNARLAKIRKGRVQTDEVDENGNSLSKIGQKVDECMTHDERTEMEKYILFYWYVDPKLGVPLIQDEQPDPAAVDLSIYEMKKNVLLKGLPERVLRRQAQR